MTVYYNEIDPFAAEWLRQLIAGGHIAPGDVDTRSIVDVRPDDLRGYTQCHFFAGIGVWSHALRLAGWPDDRPVWTMSCPCQPFSAAGKGAGFADERHLWPHAHWLISQCRPPVVLGEQVASKDGLLWLDLVQADLEGTGYTSGAVDTCAAGFGAPHIRQRLYWVAYAEGDGRAEGEQIGRRGLEGISPRRTDGRTVSGAAGGLAYADRGERDGIASGEGCVIDRQEAGWQQGDSQLERGGADGGLAYADDERSQGRIGGWDGTGERAARASSLGGQGQPCPTNGFWRDADWLFCRDGKWRPVEPRPQPMVDGTAVSLGRVRPGQIRDLEFEIAEWAIRHEVDPRKSAARFAERAFRGSGTRADAWKTTKPS
ncbi:MAG: DNA cytosine methyltransferase [Aquidulcibacter sp.]